MALVESRGRAAGDVLPEATLHDPDGRPVEVASLAGPKGLLVAITCNHCPYAQAVWPRLIDLAEHAKGLGIATVAVNPNLNPAYPDDSPREMKAEIARRGIAFPYLADMDQSFARALSAACTPEFFLYDAGRRLAYHGRLDDDWKDASRVTRHELRDAIEALASGQPIATDPRPSMGCSIKWVED